MSQFEISLDSFVPDKRPPVKALAFTIWHCGECGINLPYSGVKETESPSVRVVQCKNGHDNRLD